MTNVATKLKIRLLLFGAALFAGCIMAFGFYYSVAIAVFSFIFWKFYSNWKLLQWWKAEPPLTRSIIEFINEQLNLGVRSTNVWIRTLAKPDSAADATRCRMELMARPTLVRKEFADVVTGWIAWGASRLDECVLNELSQLLRAEKT